MLKVRALREAKGWSQQELALRAELRPATISDIERLGTANLATLSKIAAALEVHILDLFEDDRSSPEDQAILRRLRHLEVETRQALLALLPRDK